jgi:general secretion pathway protein A
MYESYWQLQKKPFENSVDTQFYFPGEPHQAALLKLRYAVENRRGGALLAGMSGTGKTLLLTMLQTALGEQYTPFIHVVYPQMTPAELLAMIADELDGKNQPLASVPECVRRIQNALAENAADDRHAVVVVDEAHLIDSTAMLETLRMLMNFGAGERPGLTLILCGHPSILPLLDRNPHLEERLGVKCLLRPLSLTETAEYTQHRLRVAGGSDPIVAADALPTLHELTRGIPRQINRLCDLALLVGFAEEQRMLSAAHFEAVCRELVAVVPE